MPRVKFILTVTLFTDYILIITRSHTHLLYTQTDFWLLKQIYVDYSITAYAKPEIDQSNVIHCKMSKLWVWPNTCKYFQYQCTITLNFMSFHSCLLYLRLGSGEFDVTQYSLSCTAYSCLATSHYENDLLFWECSCTALGHCYTCHVYHCRPCELSFKEMDAGPLFIALVPLTMPQSPLTNTHGFITANALVESHMRTQIALKHKHMYRHISTYAVANTVW